MTQGKSALTLLAATLAIGVVGGDLSHGKDPPPLSRSDILLVQNDTQAPAASSQDSAKMGKDEGTHTGPNMGATPEDDTSKVDQPPRSNPTTEGGAPGGQ